jgi:hypothetical protein
MKPKYAPRMNKKMTNLHFSDDELELIAKYAGKIPLLELTEMINKVSRVTRTSESIKRKASIQGFSTSFK